MENNILWNISHNATVPRIQVFSIILSKRPENFTQVNFLPRISIQIHFSAHFLYLFDQRPFLAILPNVTYFGHDGSYYFNDYRRTKHRPMIKQTVTESLDCLGKVDVTDRIVGLIYVTQSTNNLEI